LDDDFLFNQRDNGDDEGMDSNFEYRQFDSGLFSDTNVNKEIISNEDDWDSRAKNFDIDSQFDYES